MIVSSERRPRSTCAIYSAAIATLTVLAIGKASSPRTATMSPVAEVERGDSDIAGLAASMLLSCCSRLRRVDRRLGGKRRRQQSRKQSERPEIAHIVLQPLSPKPICCVAVNEVLMETGAGACLR